MGFYSWLTADTQESVSNSYSERGARPVYLLQPDAQPILEPEYEGYGTFGDTSAYAWLARQNLPTAELEGLSDSELYAIGVTLDMGKYYRDVATGQLLTVFHEIPQPVQRLYGLKLRHLGVNYAAPLAGFGGKSVNDLVAAKLWEEIALPRPKREIKLSFDVAASYAALPASQSCPDQGYFYE